MTPEQISQLDAPVEIKSSAPYGDRGWMAVAFNHDFINPMKMTLTAICADVTSP
jgi:hypothetical protein